LGQTKPAPLKDRDVIANVGQISIVVGHRRVEPLGPGVCVRRLNPLASEHHAAPLFGCASWKLP
jgi:hypothetical protein